MRRYLPALPLLSLCLVLSLLESATPSPAVAQDGPCPDLHDSVDTACALGEDTTLREAISAAGGRNVYRFDVQSPGTRVQVDLTDLPADYDLYLVGGGGNIVDQSVHEGTTPESLDRTLDSAGTFFVYVLADPGRAVETSAPYTLRVRLTGPRSEWTLLRSDDFSDPDHGLFLDQQRGSAEFQGSAPYAWEYGYVDGALLGVNRGPYRGTTGWVHKVADAAGRVGGDFAVEVRARAARSPEQAAYAIRYELGPGSSYNFDVRPSTRGFWLWSDKRQGVATSGRDIAISAGTGENLLRLEVRSDIITLLTNGAVLDRVTDPGVSGVRGAIGLQWYMTGPPSEGSVQVRFSDFKVYTLESPGLS